MERTTFGAGKALLVRYEHEPEHSIGDAAELLRSTSASAAADDDEMEWPYDDSLLSGYS